MDMILIRSVLFLGFNVSSTVLMFFFVVLPSLFFPPPIRSRMIGSWAVVNIWALKWICGVRYRIHGKENLPVHPGVIISNHQSTWETLSYQLIFPAVSYVIKKELFYIPLFGWAMALNRNIGINRTKRRQALIKLIDHCKQRLSEGRWVAIFPEGTRMPVGQLGEFQLGGAIMAVKTEAPVIPIAHNAGRCWPKNSFRKYPGTIDMLIGPPIETKGKKPREVNKLVRENIKKMLNQLPIQS